jgi:hypothetical protein
VHGGAQRGREAAVAGLLHQAHVPVQEVDAGLPVRRGEVADLDAELVLDVGLGAADLPNRVHVVQIGQSAM